MPDRLDARAEDIGCVLQRVLVLANESVQTGEVDVCRAGTGKFESAQQSGGRLPGHGLVMDTVLGEKDSGFVSQRFGQLGSLQGNEAGGSGSELCFVESLMVGGSFDGKPTDALEQAAAGDAFTAAASRACVCAAVDLLPAFGR
ncbi:hypothetical protein [Streptomyces sp. NPDC006510]|uniref:hypothetical protein n=1 Tax=Streptomyces sp. NPDC006510 TaxID=3155600 RepID=UPI0033B4AD61